MLSKIINPKIEDNIWKIYVHRVFFSMFLISPIFVLFLIDKGLSITQVMILEAFFALGIVVLEIPTGAFADKFGRKNSIILSNITFIFAIVIYGLGDSFLEFFIAETIFSLAVSLWSGANNAFLYDTLKNQKRESEYKKIFGSINGLEFLLFGIAGIVGSYIAKENLSIPFFATVPFYIVSTFIAFSFVEPPIKKQKSNYLQHIKTAIKYAATHKRVRFLLIYVAFFIAIVRSTWMLYQPYYKLIGIPIVLFGIVYFGGSVFSSLGAKIAHYVEKRLGERKTLQIIVLSTIISYLIVTFTSSIFGFIALFLVSFVFGMVSPVIMDYLNMHIRSHNRATVLSIRSLLENIILGAVSPFVGVITDFWSIRTAFFAMAIILLLQLVALTIMYNIKKE